MSNNSKRDRLITAAAELFHQKGITTTSLADIAGKATIPIGNVYYYFKTKDELVLAVMDKRKQLLKTAYDNLDQSVSNPRDRLIESINFYLNFAEEYTRFGCPIGNVIAEADDQKSAIAQAAAESFTVYLTWAIRQFEALGHKTNSKKYAMSLMAGIEGAAIMAKATGDIRVFKEEIARLVTWLEELPNNSISVGKAGMKAA